MFINFHLIQRFIGFIFAQRKGRLLCQYDFFISKFQTLQYINFILQGSVKQRLSDLYSCSDEEDNYGLSKLRKRQKTNAILSSDSEDIDDPPATNSDAARSDFRIDNDEDLEISENNNTLPDISPQAKGYRSIQTTHYKKKKKSCI